jgi:hypothetical protein
MHVNEIDFIVYLRHVCFQKQGGLLYSDSPNMDAPHAVRPPVQYRQDGDDDFDDDGEEYDIDGNVDHGDNSTLSTPSWV